MLQQTTVPAVKAYFAKFLERWPTVDDLAAAANDDVMAAWAGLGYYARARNLHKCAQVVAEEHGGRFPDTEAGLLELPGIGGYTAAAVAAIAFDRRAVVVDANVERVVARLFAVEDPLPVARAEIGKLAERITPDLRVGDFAQAMMDLGATICTPRTPACAICPLVHGCAGQASGAPDFYPRKRPKAAKPVRRGTMFWLESDGAVLLVRRPARGLLGGMRALPTGPWTETDPGLSEAPATADWREIGSGRHVFTHFALDYRVMVATSTARSNQGEWWPIDQLDAAGLPTVFARAARIAIPEPL